MNNPDFDRTFEYRYDKLGNITYKTDVGDYHYQSAHKHAVTQAGNKRYQYDAVGNMVKGMQTVEGKATVERELVWTDFNKPARITRNDHTTSFEYDANQQRFYREDSTGLQTLYLGKRYEQVIDTKTKLVQHKQYIYADGKLIALNIVKKDSKGELKDKQVRYMHYDALQSVDMITDGYGLIVERRSYDAWGKTRKLLWQDDNNPATLTQFTLTNRGFTGHEHLEEVGLIHMNGRVYDQELGRFISADPVIQAPYMTNSFNRYAYVMNNPLKYRDPSGYWFSDSNGNGATGTCNTDGTTTPSPSNNGANKEGQTSRKNNYTGPGSRSGAEQRAGRIDAEYRDEVRRRGAVGELREQLKFNANVRKIQAGIRTLSIMQQVATDLYAEKYSLSGKAWQLLDSILSKDDLVFELVETKQFDMVNGKMVPLMDYKYRRWVDPRYVSARVMGEDSLQDYETFDYNERKQWLGVISIGVGFVSTPIGAAVGGVSAALEYHNSRSVDGFTSPAISIATEALKYNSYTKPIGMAIENFNTIMSVVDLSENME